MTRVLARIFSWPRKLMSSCKWRGQVGVMKVIVMQVQEKRAGLVCPQPVHGPQGQNAAGIEIVALLPAEGNELFEASADAKAWVDQPVAGTGRGLGTGLR